MGDRVSKTSIKYSDPYKKALQKEHELQVILQTQVDNLEKRLEVESRDLRRQMEMFASLSQANTQMRHSTERGSSSQVQSNYIMKNNNHLIFNRLRLLHIVNFVIKKKAIKTYKQQTKL